MTPDAMAAAAAAAAGSSRRQPTTGVWRTVVACEWRLLRRDAGWWLAVLLLCACTGYALHNGHQRGIERAATLAAAQRDEAQRLAGLQAQLQRIAAGQAAPRGEAFRDPTNALAVGRGSGATVVHLPDAALAATAVGLSDLYPPSFRLSAGSQDRFLFADELANPVHLASGSFDLAFVAVYLFPLLLLALGYNVLSAEREQGTLALTAASSAPLAKVLAAKLLVRGGGLAAALLATAVAGLAAIGVPLLDAATLLPLAVLAAAVLVYGAFWLALALLVNSWRRDSAFNAVALVVAWVLLLLVAPAAINALAMGLHPAPARAEMVLAVRQAAVDVDRDREAEQARFRAEHGQAAPTADADRRALALVLAADRRADAVLARHEAMVQAQRRFSDRLAFIAPPVLMNDTLATLAGNGHTRWDGHLQRVSAFHDVWQRYFVGIAQRGARLNEAALAQRPRFSMDSAAVWHEGGGLRMLLSLIWMVLLTGCLLSLAWRRMARPA